MGNLTEHSGCSRNPYLSLVCNQLIFKRCEPPIARSETTRFRNTGARVSFGCRATTLWAIIASAYGSRLVPPVVPDSTAENDCVSFVISPDLRTLVLGSTGIGLFAHVHHHTTFIEMDFVH